MDIKGERVGENGRKRRDDNELWGRGRMVGRRTYCSDSLGDTDSSGDAKYLPEEIEHDALFRKLEEGVVALDEAGFADDVEDFGHDVVGFETAPLFCETYVSICWQGFA